VHPVRPAFRLGSPGRKTPSLAAREPERRRAQNRVRAGRRLYKSRPSERRGNVHPPTNFSIATLLPGFLFPSIKQTCLPARSPRSSSSVSPLSCRSPPRAAAAVHSRTRSQSILLTPLDRLPLLQARLSGPRRRWQTRSTRSPRSSCVPLLLRLFFGRSIIARSSLLFAPCRRG
jgi:hypothetical protein